MESEGIKKEEEEEEEEITKVEAEPVKIITEPLNIEVEPLKTDNGKNKMKIRCVKCKTEDILTEEDIKLLAHIVKRYNPNPSPNDYTAVLSIIKGNCADNKKHMFIFDESFDRAVADILKEYKDAMTANVTMKETLEKVGIIILDTVHQIKSLESSLKDLEKKKEYILSEMNTGGILIDNVKSRFEKLTGTQDTEMWS